MTQSIKRTKSINVRNKSLNIIQERMACSHIWSSQRSFFEVAISLARTQLHFILTFSQKRSLLLAIKILIESIPLNSFLKIRLVILSSLTSPQLILRIHRRHRM